ncbi:hypothetical protein ANN_04178 [Periplaneta americana]|uniref:Uncharacterized protein n=1 Tax=Periplaneta americana TaxID=6978 RepID=A0ABQ8TA98_PERAM|nr:hypothetical protein ANN_04178 [Periplaneta americana]
MEISCEYARNVWIEKDNISNISYDKDVECCLLRIAVFGRNVTDQLKFTAKRNTLKSSTPSQLRTGYNIKLKVKFNIDIPKSIKNVYSLYYANIFNQWNIFTCLNYAKQITCDYLSGNNDGDSMTGNGTRVMNATYLLPDGFSLELSVTDIASSCSGIVTNFAIHVQIRLENCSISLCSNCFELHVACN